MSDGGATALPGAQPPPGALLSPGVQAAQAPTRAPPPAGALLLGAQPPPGALLPPGEQPPTGAPPPAGALLLGTTTAALPGAPPRPGMGPLDGASLQCGAGVRRPSGEDGGKGPADGAPEKVLATEAERTTQPGTRGGGITGGVGEIVGHGPCCGFTTCTCTGTATEDGIIPPDGNC